MAIRYLSTDSMPSGQSAGIRYPVICWADSRSPLCSASMSSRLIGTRSRRSEITSAFITVSVTVFTTVGQFSLVAGTFYGLGAPPLPQGGDDLPVPGGRHDSPRSILALLSFAVCDGWASHR